MFRNNKVAYTFAHLHETLTPEKQSKFGAAIRKEADRKMTNEEDLDDYTLNLNDINRIYLTVK